MIDGIAVVYQDLALVECLDIAPRTWRSATCRDGVDCCLTVAAWSATPIGCSVGSQGPGRHRPAPRSACCQAASARSSRSPAPSGMDKPIILLDEPTAALGVQESAHVGDDHRRAATGTARRSSASATTSSSSSSTPTGSPSCGSGETVGTRRSTRHRRDEIVGLITGAHPGTPSDPTRVRRRVGMTGLQQPTSTTAGRGRPRRRTRTRRARHLAPAAPGDHAHRDAGGGRRVRDGAKSRLPDSDNLTESVRRSTVIYFVMACGAALLIIGGGLGLLGRHDVHARCA